MTIEACNQLLNESPGLAIIYLECLEPYKSNLADIKLVLSALPADFPEGSIIDLYLLAEQIIQNPDNPQPEKILAELKSYAETKDTVFDEAIDEFTPIFTRDIDALLKRKILGIETEKLDERTHFFNQYAGAQLFENKILKQREQYLAELEAADDVLDAVNAKKEIQAEQNLKSFVNKEQNSHDALVQQSANVSFAKLQKSYPKCNIENNIREVKTYLSTLTDKEINQQGKQYASALLKQMDSNSNYSDAKNRLAYVWEALKDKSKFTGTKAKDMPITQLQKNLKETLIQQLASAETNYSVEGKSYLGAGRSCPGGTKNIILQVLDDYHADVDFGYSFKGAIAPKLNNELAQARFKELFLQQMSKLPIEQRTGIIKSWNKDYPISDQGQLNEKDRFTIAYAMEKAEIELLKEYKNSQYIWHKDIKNMVFQNLGMDKASLLKPEVDLLYEYKKLLSDKNLSYKEMNDAITMGGDSQYTQELITAIGNKALAKQELLNDVIPSIKKEDLTSLSENILAKEYRAKIQPMFDKLTPDEKIAVAIWNQEGFIEMCSASYDPPLEITLSQALKGRFRQETKVKYSPIIAKEFKKGVYQNEIAEAVINGKISNIAEVDLDFIDQVYIYKKAILDSSYEELAKKKPKTEKISRELKDIANQQQALNVVVADAYHYRYGPDIKEVANFLSKYRDNKELINTFANQRNKDGDSVLILAVKAGNIQVVQSLIAAQINLNITDNYNNTPLHWAAFKGYTEIAEALINQGADLNIKNNTGANALICTTYKGYSQVTKALIDKGADLNIADNDGYTALICAAKKGYTEIAKALIDGGADLNITNNNGNTALHLANNFKTYKMLIAAGANPNISNHNGELPYQHLAMTTRFLLWIDEIYTSCVDTFKANPALGPSVKASLPKKTITPAILKEAREKLKPIKGIDARSNAETFLQKDNAKETISPEILAESNASRKGKFEKDLTTAREAAQKKFQESKKNNGKLIKS